MGVARVYYESGLLQEESYKDGKRHGIAKWFDKDGGAHHSIRVQRRRARQDVFFRIHLSPLNPELALTYLCYPEKLSEGSFLLA